MIDKDYLDYIYNKVDKQVLYSHTEDESRGRANVWVKRMEHKGKYQDFAIPEKGEIDVQINNKNGFVELSQSKLFARYSSGFVVSKMMPIDVTLLEGFNVERSQEFRAIATEITHKENELIAKTKAHLKRLEQNMNEPNSTNVDKQLQFLNARAELLNYGYKEEEIYAETFETNILNANVLKETEKEQEKRKWKSKEIDLN